MYMSPDQYRGKLKSAEECLARAKEIVSGKTKDGLILPVVFLDDVKSNITEINVMIGSLKECVSSLKSPKKKEEYEAIRAEMVLCESKLQDVLMKFVK